MSWPSTRFITNPAVRSALQSNNWKGRLDRAPRSLYRQWIHVRPLSCTYMLQRAAYNRDYSPSLPSCYWTIRTRQLCTVYSEYCSYIAFPPGHGAQPVCTTFLRCALEDLVNPAFTIQLVAPFNQKLRIASLCQKKKLLLLRSAGGNAELFHAATDYSFLLKVVHISGYIQRNDGDANEAFVPHSAQSRSRDNDQAGRMVHVSR